MHAYRVLLCSYFISFFKYLLPAVCLYMYGDYGFLFLLNQRVPMWLLACHVVHLHVILIYLFFDIIRHVSRRGLRVLKHPSRTLIMNVLINL